MIGVDRAGIQLLEAVVITVEHLGIDREGVVAAHHRILCADGFEALDHGVDVGLQQVLQLFVIWLVLKDRGKELACGAGAALLVHQIGKNLLCLAALKADVRAVGRKHVKVAEALHPQLGVFLRHDRKTQVGKLLFYLCLIDGLHNIAARVQAHGVAGVIRKTGHKNNIHFGVDGFQLLGKLHAVHSAHVDVEKGNVAAALLRCLQQLARLSKGRDLRIGLALFDRHFQHFQCQRLIINTQYFHQFVPPSAKSLLQLFLFRSRL